MIRDANFRDIPDVETMLREMLALSKYAGRMEYSDSEMRSTLESAVATQNQPGPGGTLFLIAEQDGKVCGFMVGMLSRVYHISNKLVAQDAWLYARKGSRAAHTFQMIDKYIAWAQGNRRVIEINLSWQDALPGAARVAGLYRRKGFTQVGEIFEMRLDLTARKEAA